MKNSRTTNQLVVSALLVALLIAVSMLGMVPFLSLISLATAPLIVTMIHTKGGGRNVLLSFVATMFLLSILINPIYGITLTLFNYLTGTGLIIITMKKPGVLWSILILAFFIALGYVVMAVIDLSIMVQMDLRAYIQLTIEETRRALLAMLETLESSGLSADREGMLQAVNSITVEAMLAIIPTFIAIYALIAAILIYKVSVKVLKKFDVLLPEIPKLTDIKTNMIYVLGTLSLTLFGVFLFQQGWILAEGLMLMGNNLFQLGSVLGGLSLLNHFMLHRLKYGAFMRYLFLFLIVNSSFFLVLVIAGVIDSAFDFRNLSEGGLYSILQKKLKSS